MVETKMAAAEELIAEHVLERKTLHAHNTSFHQLLNADVHTSIHALHDFFTEFLPELLLFMLILLGAFSFIVVTILALGFLLRQCGVPEHYRRLTLYTVGILLGLTSLIAAFGAIGISFADLFIGFGLIAIAFSAGFSDTIANAVSGIILQTTNIFESHNQVTVDGVTGEIIRMNLRHVEIRPNTASTTPNSDTTIFIPNAVLARSAITVYWQGHRAKEGPLNTIPTRAPMTSYNKIETGTGHYRKTSSSTPSDDILTEVLRAQTANQQLRYRK